MIADSDLRGMPLSVKQEIVLKALRKLDVCAFETHDGIVIIPQQGGSEPLSIAQAVERVNELSAKRREPVQMPVSNAIDQMKQPGVIGFTSKGQWGVMVDDPVDALAYARAPRSPRRI